MTCYIIDRKANDFGRMSGFAVTVAIAICGFFCVCVLSTSASSVLCLLLRPLYLVHSVCICCASISHLLVCFFRSLLRRYLLCLGESSACLRFPWLAPSISAIPRWVVCLSAFSVTCPICVCYPLRLRLLYLGKSSTLFASFVTCSICVCCLCLFYVI